MGMVAGCPRIVGAENELNRFSFILAVNRCCGLVSWGFL